MVEHYRSKKRAKNYHVSKLAKAKVTMSYNDARESTNKGFSSQHAAYSDQNVASLTAVCMSILRNLT